jgi:hypothetical protein
VFTPNTEVKDEFKYTSIQITCLDEDGNMLKRVTSGDNGDIEDNENGSNGTGNEGDENLNGGGTSGNENLGGDDNGGTVPPGSDAPEDE